ncbi:hypothetical protein H6P81_003375 [Aristolochia fimbriata]|uniref:Uncharacterized protein n=1 Tax=Aristolochia fimbriata TaxID=158543 RepID=A0AAV7FGH9_ARIFI|nr:hypothetical protein H6P81_003375 [Aristolochia fimbriata]
MAAPSVTLISGLRAFDHTMTVGEERVLTLALYMEGNASRLTYCPSGELVFGAHAVKPPSLVDCSLPYGSLSRSLVTGDRVFFIPCPGSSEDEAVAAGPDTFALQSALLVANRPPRTLQDRFMDGELVKAFQAPNTTLDTPIPFLYEFWDDAVALSVMRVSTTDFGPPSFSIVAMRHWSKLFLTFGVRRRTR